MMHVAQTVISRLWNPYQQTHTIDDRRISGRPRKTTPPQERLVITMALRHQLKNCHADKAPVATGSWCKRICPDGAKSSRTWNLFERDFKPHFFSLHPPVSSEDTG